MGSGNFFELHYRWCINKRFTNRMSIDRYHVEYVVTCKIKRIYLIQCVGILLTVAADRVLYRTRKKNVSAFLKVPSRDIT